MQGYFLQMLKADLGSFTSEKFLSLCRGKFFSGFINVSVNVVLLYHSLCCQHPLNILHRFFVAGESILVLSVIILSCTLWKNMSNL
jgi:hypothetical protein